MAKDSITFSSGPSIQSPHSSSVRSFALTIINRLLFVQLVLTAHIKIMVVLEVKYRYQAERCNRRDCGRLILMDRNGYYYQV